MQRLFLLLISLIVLLRALRQATQDRDTSSLKLMAHSGH